MSFRDLIDTAKSVALANSLLPDDEANWHTICREYSKIFHTPLHLTLNLDPEFVVTQVFSESFSRLDLEEDYDNIYDTIHSLKDPEYDIKRERAYRDELKRMVEEEKQRLERGEAIHASLEKTKPVKEEKPIEDSLPKNLPKQGSLNMDIINRLQNEERETGDF